MKIPDLFCSVCKHPKTVCGSSERLKERQNKEKKNTL